MKQESRQRLEHALFMQKVKWAGGAAIIVCAVAAMLYWRNLDASVTSSRSISGTVSYVGPLQGRYQVLNTRGNLQVDVTLEDKRVAHLTVAAEKAPKLGDQLNVAEKVHGSGRHTFAWQ